MDPSNPVNQPLVSRHRLRELANIASPGERLEPNVEGIMIKIAEDFVSKVAQSSADLAKHRKSKALEVDDLLLHLERVWDLSIPGYGNGEINKAARPTQSSEKHQQQVNLVQRERSRQQ